MALTFLTFLGMPKHSFGQFTITTEAGTNYTGGNGVTGSAAVTFSIRNNNADPMILTGLDVYWQTANNNTNVVLWYTDITLGGPTEGISTPNWQTITTAGPIAVPSNDYYPTFTGLSFIIPGNTTYRFAIQSSAGIRYSGTTPIPTPSIFSVNGIDLGVYDADFGSGIIGYGGAFPTPPNQPRAFTGRVHLLPATPCAGTPNGGTANATPTIGCQNGTTSLSLSGATFGNGITYQWYDSPDDIAYNIIAGATTANYAATVSFAGNNYYRCEVTCVNSGLSDLSLSVLVNGSAQLNGVYTINNLNPTGGTNFNNFQDAFAALACGASGPVTLNVEDGQTFSSAGPLIANFSGSALNPIVFQKSGAGANPSISFTGTTATTDAGLQFEGSDWITWDGIDILQGGTIADDWIERGIYIRKASATNGSSNNTFRNFSIDLGANTATTLRGVFMENAIASTSPDGGSNNNTFENLTITNANSAGLWLAGSTTQGNQDVNNKVDGCNITLQSAAAVMYGIYMTGQENFEITDNTIGNYNSNSTSTLNLIYITGTATTTNGIIQNNTIENVANSGTGIIYGIQIFNGGSFDISQNTVRNLSTTGAIRGIYLNGVAATVSTVHKNRIYGINSNSVGTAYAAGIQSAPGINTIYNNMITGITAETSTATPAVRGIDITGGASQEIYNNTVIISGSASASAAMAWSTSTIQFDVRNNILVNNSTGANFAAAMYRSTAGNPNFATTSGNNLYYAGVPSSTNPIYRNAANSVEDLTAYLALGVETVAYTENLQFTLTDGEVAINQSIETFVESGGQNIPLVDVDYYGTARGPYPLAGQQPNGGTSTDVGAEENDFMRNVPAAAPNCATLDSPLNNATDICASSPLTLSWTPSTSGAIATDGFDVFFGTTNPPPFVANVSTTNFSAPSLISGQTYFWSIEPSNAVGNAVGCDVFSFTVANHSITSTTPGSVCGIGTVDLEATASSGDIFWYQNASGGAPIGSGGTFTTPELTSTTSFYVSTSLGGSTFNTSKLAPEPASTGTVLSTYGQVFTADVAFTLNSVQVFSTTGSAITISLFNDNGTVLLETTGSVAVTPGTSPIIPLNFNITPGTYRLAINGMTGNFIRDNTGVSYPFALANGIGTMLGFHSAITGAVATTSSYYFAYNWNVSTGCESNRVPVVATVTPADAITISASADNTCPADLVTLTASSTNTNYTYTWTPGNATGASLEVNPTTTSVYEVFGTDGICSNTQSITVNVLPGAVAGTANGNDICVSGPTELTLSGSNGDIQWQSFNGTIWVDEAGVGSTTNSYSVSPLVLTEYRAQVTIVGCPSLFSNTVSIDIIDPQLVSTLGDSRCGEGLVDLNATPAGSATVSWYADAVGGTPLAAGNTYSPYVTTTTTFYAAPFDGEVPTNVGYPENNAGTSGAGLANFGIVFDALVPFTLQQVTVYPVSASSSSGTLTIDVIDENNNVLNTGVFNVVGSPGGVDPVVLPLNFNIATGTNLKLRCSERVGVTGLLFQPSAAAPGGNWGYPFEIPGVVSLLYSTLTAAPLNTPRIDLYYYFYDWVVGAGCEGVRVPVVATVVPAEDIIVAPSTSTSCPGDLVTLAASSANTNYVYTWSPGGLTGASIEVNPTETTTYTVAADDGVCFAQEEITITVNGAVAGSISSDASICAGDDKTIFLTGTVGDIQWQEFDGITWNDIPGETGSTLVVTPGSTTQYRAAIGFAGCPIIFSDTNTITVSAPEVIAVQNGITCGAADVTVGATPSAGGTIEWFDAPIDGNSLGTGPTYTTNITENTTFYAQANTGGGNATTGKPTYTSTVNTSGNNWGLVFDVVNNDVVINSVDVYSVGAGGQMTVELRDNTGALLQTVGTYTYPAGSTAAPVLVTFELNLPVTVGTGYRLVSAAMTGNLIRETSGNTFPYNGSDNNVNITSGFITNPGSNTYYWFYNWQISSGCESPRVPVEATIAPPVPSGTDVVSACNSYTWIDGNTYFANTNTATYTFVGGASNGCDSLVTLNLTMSYYTVLATSTGPISITSSPGATYQWVTCPDYTPIPGATTANYTATVNGEYAVISSGANGCVDTSNCVNIASVSIEDFESNGVSIYPNPTSAEVIIEFSAAIARIEVTDAQGKLILSTSIVSGDVISLDNEQSGVYFVKIITEYASTVHRIVKQ